MKIFQSIEAAERAGYSRERYKFIPVKLPRAGFMPVPLATHPRCRGRQ